MVKELHTGQPWFFPAQCWLAASRGDGRVMREITCLHQGLGFRKLFYFKFMEYLEDFHIWLSVYSRPSSSRYLHTHRLTVAFSLLCVYSCLAASAAAGGQEQLPMVVTPTAVTAASFRLALLCSLLASPGAQLLSLLFQLSKEDSRPARAQLHSPLREAQAEATLGPDSSGRLSGPQEPCQHPPSAVPSASARARRKAADSSGMACPHQELEAQEADHCQSSLREKSVPHSPCSQAPSSGLEGLVAQQLKAHLPWSDFAAWAVCGTVSLACGLGTGFLGYRFGPAQCEQWLCLLSLSLVCCVFVTQPLMICIVALGFAWKRRDDHHFFTESLGEATRNLDSELEGLARMPFALSPHRCLPECAGQARQVLAARLRARHLRLVHPPSTDELKDTRARLRRENRTQAALRWVSPLGGLLWSHSLFFIRSW
ncbi:polycystic kidney disease protein 1-like 1 isoform X2 [Tupaia chinensis]|nr:polycystic kidney disease protein 1-like 1 isoform X2 [Tupaia chinensis]